MIGALPKALTVDGVVYDIDSDFRTALLIFEAYNDPALSPYNKQITMLELLYTPVIPPNTHEAVKQAVLFLDVGQDHASRPDRGFKTMDYVQDEQMLFSAVNSVFARDIREEEYLHWWTFYGLCQAIDPESLISHIINIRYKKATGKKLEKYEQQFYKENAHLINFRTSDDAYDDMVKKLRGG